MVQIPPNVKGWKEEEEMVHQKEMLGECFLVVGGLELHDWLSECVDGLEWNAREFDENLTVVKMED